MPRNLVCVLRDDRYWAGHRASTLRMRMVRGPPLAAPLRGQNRTIRDRAYLIWEGEGRPEGRAEDHWRYATIESFGDERVRDDEPMEDEEKILAGRIDA